MPDHVIPPMTDPLGRHWGPQPPRERIEMDDTHALMTEADYRSLREYSGSYPSGTYAGKMWRRENNGGRWLCWYHEIGQPDRIGIGCREVLLV